MTNFLWKLRCCGRGQKTGEDPTAHAASTTSAVLHNRSNMAERRETTIKTEYRDGKKIVTTTTVVTTDLGEAGSANRHNQNTEGAGGGVIMDEGFVNISDFFGTAKITPCPASPKAGFEKEALKRHNHHRARHGVRRLKWCSKCTEKAQGHADFLAQTNTFSHSKDKGFGENLYTSTHSIGPQISAKSAIDSWYDEINLMECFGEPSPNNFSQVGHFTQLVWKGTTHVGMAYAVTGNSVYVVANYLPPGNVIGKFHENVLPPQ